MNSVKTTTPIQPNRKKENIKESILFADALMSQLLINQSRHHPNRPLYYPVLHLWTFKTPIFTELKKSKNVKSIMMVLLFPLLFWLLKR